MQKVYQKPEVEVVVLVTEEIANGAQEGTPDVEFDGSNGMWDDL